jgi:hypothetical protein
VTPSCFGKTLYYFRNFDISSASFFFVFPHTATTANEVSRPPPISYVTRVEFSRTHTIAN